MSTTNPFSGIGEDPRDNLPSSMNSKQFLWGVVGFVLLGLGGCMVLFGVLVENEMQGAIAGLGVGVCAGGYSAILKSRERPPSRRSGAFDPHSENSAFVECPFCHERVFRGEYARHEQMHTRQREDGQMVDHVTLKPIKRFEGSLDDVPQTYLHPKCGVVTRMPEDIIRSYLVNPTMYTDSTFCCGCGTYVFSAELFWETTGEAVIDYMAQLRTAYFRRTMSSLNLDQQKVIVTPRAARAFQEIAHSSGRPAPHYLSLEFADDTSDAGYKLDLSPEFNAETETRLESSGVVVVYRQDQAELLKQVVVDYPGGEREGFFVGRISQS